MVAPTNPGWSTGYVPTADEWAAAFSGKVDFPAPINQGGTGAQSAFSANYNIAQRSLIAASGVTVEALAFYGINSSVGAITVDLPPLASLANGDWIQFIDIDNDASTHNITITANGSDEIDLNGSLSSSKVLNVNGVYAMIMVNDGVWTMVKFATSGSVVLPGPITGSGLTESTDTLLGRTTTGSGAVEEITVGAGLDLAAGELSSLSNNNRLFNFSILGTALTTGERVASLVPPVGETWTYPANLAGSVGKKLSSGTNPAATYNIDVRKNGSSVGTISIDTSGVVTFATSGGTPFTLTGGSDYLSVVGPTGVDTVVDYTFMLLATYTF